MPVRFSLTILALGVILAFLRLAADFVIPVVLAAILAFLLMPLMRLTQRVRLPAAVGAAVLILGLVGLGAVMLGSVADDAVHLAARMPDIARDVALKLRQGVTGLVGGGLAGTGLAADGPGGFAIRPNDDVSIDNIGSPTVVRDVMTTTASQLLSGAGRFTAVLLLTFFFLMSADGMKRRLIIMAGDSLERKKIALRAVDESARQTQYFLAILAATNILLGLLAWPLLLWFGVENAGAWALLLAVLHTVPYFGAAAATVLIAGATLLQTESWLLTVQVAVGLTLICTVIGALVTTFLQGRVSRMDPAVVFIGVLLFAWLWGAWGLLLGAPLLAILKSVADLVGASRLSAALSAQDPA